MKNLTWQNPEQLFVAQELINKVKSKCCGIKDIYKKFDINKLSSVYLLDDEKIHVLKNNGLMLFSGVGAEIETLSNLFCDSDYQFTKKIDIRKLENWNVLKEKFSPCSDIIICDPYLFSCEELLDVNVYSLLETLCSFAKAKVNIVIFTSIFFYDKQSKCCIEPNWEEIKKRIKFVIEKSVGIKPNVTIIKTSQLNEHDRMIFTNYKYIDSGDSFAYFDSKGNKITRGRNLTISSLCDWDTYNFAMDFIKDMQYKINDLLKINSSCIIGDRECNFFKFK